MNEWTCEELRARLEAGEPVSVVDIREPAEHEAWNILGSRNLAVYDALRRDHVEPLIHKAAELPRGVPVVTVCRMGVVARKAAAVLRTLGFEAATLEGGMHDWSGVWAEAPIDGKLAPGTTLIQVQRLGKGCLSYVLGSEGEAIVIDPCVDIAAYETIADREGLRITHVLETHIHADHVSRALQLAESTGAKLLLPPNDRVRFPYVPFADGETLRVGKSVVRAIATPGHTGESTTYLIDDRVLLTGDTLFPRSFGRPDLERGDAGAEKGARTLHGSLRRILELNDELWIYAGHHSGTIPFDRQPLGARLGDVRPQLTVLEQGEDVFAREIVAGLGAKPPNFETVLAVNEGRSDLGDDEPLDLEAGPNRCAAS
jgi:glyoxylase-like metal-dependent hydrolase (beta-lactamase superfamily II)/rhodanese-related sulfurtransferase